MPGEFECYDDEGDHFLTNHFLVRSQFKFGKGVLLLPDALCCIRYTFDCYAMPFASSPVAGITAKAPA